MVRACAQRCSLRRRLGGVGGRTLLWTSALVIGGAVGGLGACAAAPTTVQRLPGGQRAVHTTQGLANAPTARQTPPARRPPARQRRADAAQWGFNLTPPRPRDKGRRSVRPVLLASSRRLMAPQSRRARYHLSGGPEVRPAAGSLRAAIAQRARRLAPCFVRARGVLYLQLFIRTTGRVGRISDRGTAPASVRRCVRRRASRWSFGPLPRTVSHKLTLRAMGETH